MPRPSFAELRAQIAATFPDNTAGAITPAAVRTYLTNALAAIQPGYGKLVRQTLAATIVANVSPAVKVTWEAAGDSDPTQTTSNFTNGNIVRTERGTSRITFTADLEAANGRFVTFALFKNGVATPWRITGNGGGVGNPIGVSLAAIDYADPAATYDIRMTAELANTSVTLTNMVMLVEVVPVNTY